MKIGLLVAVETESVFEYYKEIKKLDSPKGFNLYYTKRGNNEIYILHTGMGEVAASCGVQYLITGCKAEIIVNFGVVGGLTKEMQKQKLCVIERVVHYNFDCSGFMDLKKGQVDGHDSIFLPTDKNLLKKAVEIVPDLKIATCCSADVFVAKEEDKANLAKEFSGDVCDMESSGIVLTCEINKVPCLLLKAVSDGLSGGAREFYEELKDASIICLKVTDAIINSL